MFEDARASAIRASDVRPRLSGPRTRCMVRASDVYSSDLVVEACITGTSDVLV